MSVNPVGVNNFSQSTQSPTGVNKRSNKSVHASSLIRAVIDLADARLKIAKREKRVQAAKSVLPALCVLSESSRVLLMDEVMLKMIRFTPLCLRIFVCTHVPSEVAMGTYSYARTYVRTQVASRSRGINAFGRMHTYVRTYTYIYTYT